MMLGEGSQTWDYISDKATAPCLPKQGLVIHCGVQLFTTKSWTCSYQWQPETKTTNREATWLAKWWLSSSVEITKSCLLSNPSPPDLPSFPLPSTYWLLESLQTIRTTQSTPIFFFFLLSLHKIFMSACVHPIAGMKTNAFCNSYLYLLWTTL